MTESIHDFLQKTFTYDAVRGRLVRRFKSTRGPGRAGEDLKPIFNKENGLHTARVGKKLMNYARIVWLWHHPTCVGYVKAPRDDFRIENLTLYGPDTYNGCAFLTRLDETSVPLPKPIYSPGSLEALWGCPDSRA